MLIFKSIFVFVFSFIGFKIFANEVRDDFVITKVDLIDESKVEEFLNSKGIGLDKSSDISIYEENNFIDIYVFNGVIINIESEAYVSSSRNERT